MTVPLPGGHFLVDGTALEGGPRRHFRGWIAGVAPGDAPGLAAEVLGSGPEGLAALGGAFCGCVVEGGRVVAFNDRFGFGGLWLWEEDGS